MEDKYDRTVTGLAVCLGIAVLFGVIMSIIVGWDCMAKVAAKKKKQMEMQKARLAAKRAGYTGYEESEKIDLDPNDTNSNPDYEGYKSGARSSAPVNAYHSMNPNGERNFGNTHINRAYMIDDDTDRYHELGTAAASAATANPPPNYNNFRGATGGVPEPAAEIEVHSVDEDLRARMEFDRSTPEGSVGLARNNEPPSSSSNPSRYDIRSPRFNDYNSNMSSGYPGDANKYPTQGFGAVNGDASSRYQPDSYNNYNDGRNKSPGTWSTKSAGLPPTSAVDGNYYAPDRNAYSEKPPRDFQGRSGYSEPRQLDFAQGKTGSNPYGNTYEKSGAYIDKTDTVV